jgi:hypothetical protein
MTVGSMIIGWLLAYILAMSYFSIRKENIKFV